MVVVATRFSPEVLVSAPRRGAAVPNGAGSLALYTVSTHRVGAETTKEIRVVTIPSATSCAEEKLLSGQSSQLVADEKVHDAKWLAGNVVLYLRSGDKGLTHVVTADADAPSKPHRVVADIPAPVALSS